MGKVKDLIANASRDLEIAKARKRVRDYVTAIFLYRMAMEKALKALFIRRTHKEPPQNASIGYLASRTGMPDEVSVYITTLQQKQAPGPAEFTDLVQTNGSAEMRAFYMDGLAKRLLDYVTAYSR